MGETAVIGVRVVVERFPEHAQRVRRLYEDDEDFRSVCDDYLEAVNARKRFAADFGERHEKTEEYRVVVGELEVEIRQALSDNAVA